jgi:heme exporter protein C
LKNSAYIGNAWYGLLTAALMLTALGMIFLFAPEEKSMGLIQKIFYFHVPLAWVSFLAFTVIFVCSILYLAKGKIIWDNIALASGKIGVIFNTLMLITGVFWGKSVWGIWWTWDPRLTTSLILWFIYVGYLLIRHFGFEKEQGARFAAVIGIIGFADVPIVALSITFWQTLHPSALVFENGLSSRMLLTLMISLIAFSSLYLYLVKTEFGLHKQEEIVNEAEAILSADEENNLS